MLRVRYCKYISYPLEYLCNGYISISFLNYILYKLLDKFSAGFDQSPDESPGKSGKYRGVKLVIMSCKFIDQDNYFYYIYCDILYRSMRDKK